MKTRNMRIRASMLLLMFTAGMMLMSGCQKKVMAEAPSAPSKPSAIVLATTTSTEQTGLLDTLIPAFTKQTGVEVKVVAVGTGQALEMGKNGEADVLLVHAKSSEEEFVKEGYGLERHDVMYNDFVLVGKAPLQTESNEKIGDAFKYIQENKIPFVSRGDDSGTHKKEISIWKKIGIEPSGDWYISAGKGMGEVLMMADEKNAYTLSDRGTYLSMKDKFELQVVVEKDKDLLNQYGVIAVNPEKNPAVHAEEANMFVDWILSKEIQQMIGEFGIKEYGEPLFIPNAEK